jgi:hypothetical protein
MDDVLKIKEGRWKGSKSCSFNFVPLGQRFLCTTIFHCLNFYHFVPLSPFSGAYLCIFPVFLGCAPLCFSMNHLFIKKKKKNYLSFFFKKI